MPSKLRTLIEDDGTRVHVSAASAWEIATKHRLGKMPEATALIADLPNLLEACEFIALPISIEHGRRAGLLAGSHRDPFDRMLAAQAIVENMSLVSLDPALAPLGARILW